MARLGFDGRQQFVAGLSFARTLFEFVEKCVDEETRSRFDESRSKGSIEIPSFAFCLCDDFGTAELDRAVEIVEGFVYGVEVAILHGTR